MHLRINKKRKADQSYLMLKTAVFGLPILLASCIYEDVNNPAESISADQLTLQLKLTLPAAGQGTRAGNHADDPGEDVENYIDVKGEDFRVVIYDADDGSLITDNVTMLEFEKENSAGDKVVYSLLGEIDLREDADRQLDNFYVMVIANWNAYGDTNGYSNFDFSNYKMLQGDSSDIYGEQTSLNFTSPIHNSVQAWTPSISDKKLLPMFGVSDKISVKQAVEGHIFLDQVIPMLRSVAKVEIVDALPPTTPITGITLSKAVSNGRFIPDIRTNTQWNDDRVQVTNPTLPSSLLLTDNIPLFKSDKVFYVEDDPDPKNIWVAYIPEMALQSTSYARPNFNVFLNNGTDAKPVKFTNYNDKGEENTALPLNNVLRNHIYRYTIQGSSIEFEVGYEVLDWDVQSGEEDEVLFDDVMVAEDGWLKWKLTYGEGVEGHDPDELNGYIDDRDRFRLTMKDGVTEYAEASFKFSKPMKARWQASLIYIQGQEGAFKFVTGETDSEGNLIEGGDSGVIDGDEIRIRIANTNEVVRDINNEYKLVIRVQMPDKTWVEADVCLNSEGKPVNYTIVQNRNVL